MPVKINTKDGATLYMYKGEFHREDGPAIIDADGGQTWMKHGLRHRVGGPAVTEPDGTKEWWYEGRLVCFKLPEPWNSMLNKAYNLNVAIDNLEDEIYKVEDAELGQALIKKLKHLVKCITYNERMWALREKETDEDFHRWVDTLYKKVEEMIPLYYKYIGNV